MVKNKRTYINKNLISLYSHAKLEAKGEKLNDYNYVLNDKDEGSNDNRE
jgi:hypothetical protein